MKNCDRCGAPVKNLVCDYCGSFVDTSHDIETELKALDEYHQLLQKAEDRKIRVNLLENGFLPHQRQVLIEAGIRCIPLIERQATSDVQAATRRLAAIVTKLKVMPPAHDIQQALPEFEAKVTEAQDYQRKFDRILLTIILAGFVSCCGGIIFVIRSLVI